MDVLGVSVVDLLAHLLGQGQLDGLAGGVGQASDALLEGLGFRRVARLHPEGFA